MIVLLLTPREAVDLHDQILDPAEFPWQNQESQMTSMSVRAQLNKIVHQDSGARMKMVGDLAELLARAEEARERAEQEGEDE